MDVGAMSMDLSLAMVQQSAGLSVVKKAMDSQEIAAAGLIEMAKAAAPRPVPVGGLGRFVDVRA